MVMKIRKSKILCKGDIDNEAIRFLEEYSPNSLQELNIIDLESIAEFKLNLKIEYQKLDENGDLLGMTIFKTGYVDVINEDSTYCKKKFEKGTIILNEILINDLKLQGRYQFTLAHELGHWILHRKEFIEDENQINLFDIIGDITDNDCIKCLNRDVVDNKVIAGGLKTDLDWLEWQANYFGASILMPRRLIKQYYSENYNNKDIKQMAKEISETCGVSKQAAEIRIKDTNDDKSIKNQLVMEDIK